MNIEELKFEVENAAYLQTQADISTRWAKNIQVNFKFLEMEETASKDSGNSHEIKPSRLLRVLYFLIGFQIRDSLFFQYISNSVFFHYFVFKTI